MTVVGAKEQLVGCTAVTSVAMQPSRIASNQHGAAHRATPMFIPTDQAYFWSSQWQQGEAETRANLKVGNAKTFDDPLDAIRHLLDDAS